MSTDLVFFIYRLGIKVYRVGSNLQATELIDVPTLDVEEIATKLAAYSGSTARVLISDTVSYLFHTQISLGGAPISRELVLSKIKNEIPENIEAVNWDYKVITSKDGLDDVLIFAPVLEYQTLITDISAKLKISFETIEPESIALTRHPDPVVGLYKKNDLRAPDDQTLNISVTPPSPTSHNSILKPIIVIVIITLVVIVNYFIYNLYKKTSPQKSVIKVTPTPVTQISPTITPIPTTTTFNFTIQNGTSKTGYASTIALKFTTAGFIGVTTGNADNKNYLKSKLIFKDTLFQDLYQSKLIAVFPVLTSNISIDKTITYDAILILGTD